MVQKSLINRNQNEDCRNQNEKRHCCIPLLQRRKNPIHRRICRRFFVLRGTTLEYSLGPTTAMFSSTAGPSPPDHDTYAGVRGKYDLNDIELKSIDQPINLLHGSSPIPT